MNYPGLEVGAPPGLVNSESGGRWDAIGPKTKYGRPIGRLQFIPPRLQDARKGLGLDFSDEQFKSDPDLQKKVEQWHFQDLRKGIEDRGLTQYIGQTIGGTPITMDGMLAAAHLGGIGGLTSFLKSGGKANPSDVLGTSLADYMKRHSTPQGPQDTPVDARTAGENPMEGGFAADPNTLPDRGSPMGDAWLPEGYGSANDWIMAPPQRAPLIQNGKLSIGALMGLKKANPEQQIAQRIAITQAMRQLSLPSGAPIGSPRSDPQAPAPAPMTEYQRERMRLAREKFEREKQAYEPSGMPVSGEPQAPMPVPGEPQAPQGPQFDSDLVLPESPELFKQRYGDGGTTGVKEYNQRVEAIDTQLSGVAEAMDIMERGFESGALGPGLNQGTIVGRTIDTMGALAGVDASVEDQAIRSEVEQIKFSLIQPFLNSMKGALSDKDMKLLLDTAPGPSSSQAES